MFNTTNSFFFILNIVTGSLMNMFVYLCSPQKLRTICVCVCVYSSPCWLCQLFPLFTSALLKTQSQTAPRPTQSPPTPSPPHPLLPPPHAPSGQHRRHMGGSSPNLTYVDPQLIARPNSPWGGVPTAQARAARTQDSTDYRGARQQDLGRGGPAHKRPPLPPLPLGHLGHEP